MAQSASKSKHPPDEAIGVFLDQATESRDPADALIALLAHCGAVRQLLELMENELAPLSGSAAIVDQVSYLQQELVNLRGLVRVRIEGIRADRAIAAASLEEEPAIAQADGDPGPRDFVVPMGWGSQPALPTVAEAMAMLAIDKAATREELRAAIAACECRVQPSFRHGCSQCNELRARLAGAR